MSRVLAIISQKFWQSPVFWIALVLNVSGIVVLVVTPDTAVLIKAITAAIVIMIDTAASINNPTNPQGVGANTQVKE